MVRVQFPDGPGRLLGPAVGRIYDGDGNEVQTFVFESGWDLSEIEAGKSWVDVETPATTGAPTEIEISRPESGEYSFELGCRDYWANASRRVESQGKASWAPDANPGRFPYYFPIEAQVGHPLR